MASAAPTMAAVTVVKVRDKDTQSAVSVTCNGTSNQFVVHKRQLETYLDKLGLLAYAQTSDVLSLADASPAWTSLGSAS